MKQNFFSKVQHVFGGKNKDDPGMRSKKIDIISRNDEEYGSSGGLHGPGTGGNINSSSGGGSSAEEAAGQAD